MPRDLFFIFHWTVLFAAVTLSNRTLLSYTDLVELLQMIQHFWLSWWLKQQLLLQMRYLSNFGIIPLCLLIDTVYIIVLVIKMTSRYVPFEYRPRHPSWVVFFSVPPYDYYYNRPLPFLHTSFQHILCCCSTIWRYLGCTTYSVVNHI